MGGGIFLGISTNLFANGGGGGGPGGVTHKPTGNEYRCFSKIGFTMSNATQETGGIGIGQQYCIPSPNGNKGCKKEWEWSVNGKDDNVKETNTSQKCTLQCKSTPGVATIGLNQPYKTHSYCVDKNEWSKVAKCVDKSTGQTQPNSICDADTNGTNHYYKPKCNDNDTKEQCEQKLSNIGLSKQWRFCYDNGQQVLKENAGGQSVIYTEYAIGSGMLGGQVATFPCEQISRSPSGGTTTEPSKDEGGNLVILDEQDGDMKQIISKVHTKISGKDYKFRIFAVDSAGQFSSGINTLNCTIQEKNGTTFSAQAKENSFFNAIFGGKGKNFIFGTYSPQSSGEASISCVGTSTSGKLLSATTNFFIAPHSYSYNIINAEFDGHNENLINNINNKLPLTLDYSTNENASKEIVHNNDKWNKKPVVKIGSAINISLAEAQAMSAKNAIDTGVDSANGIGTIFATPKVQVQGITNANNTPPTTANSTCATANPLNLSSINMTQGKASGDTLFSISEASTLLGQVEVGLLDRALHDKIKAEMVSGKCQTSGNFPCPYPQTLLLKFDYEVVPNDFKIELLDNNGKALKVLYFGQGSTPEIEEGNRLKLTALKLDKTTATTFTNNCSSQNLALEIPKISGKGFSLEIVDKSGAKPFIIPANKFTNGIADNIEAIIKVDKDNGVPFTPNMKSEPIITTKSFPNGIPATLSFAQFPNSYYPKYDATLDNNMLILRARINAIDTDNNATNFNNASPSRIYYEFQCEYCNLDEVGKITGVNNYEKSPTQQGWWIDKTFSTYNATQITKDKVEIENLGNTPIKNVSNITNGFQEISYNFLGAGTYKLNIRHGIIKDGAGNILQSMPNFLLHNSYWNNNVRWNTSAFIYIKGRAEDEHRNYGVDTGGAKNTRSGGRIGKY